MDNCENRKAFGEWLCSIVHNPIIKSFTHDSIRAMYERDYIAVTNLCYGFGNNIGNIPEISMSTIEGAKERYIQFNKAALEADPFLSEDKKKEVSAQIDNNAENLKQQWINILRQRGIYVKFNE